MKRVVARARSITLEPGSVDMLRVRYSGTLHSASCKTIQCLATGTRALCTVVLVAMIVLRAFRATVPDKVGTGLGEGAASVRVMSKASAFVLLHGCYAPLGLWIKGRKNELSRDDRRRSLRSAIVAERRVQVRN